jgi:hypothetical protein
VDRCIAPGHRAERADADGDHEALARRSGEGQERIRTALFQRLGDPERAPSNRDLVDRLKPESVCQRSYKLSTVSSPVDGKGTTVEEFIKQLASQDRE